MWNLKNPLYRKVFRFFKDHEFECLEKADYTTCLTHAAKAEMQRWDYTSGQVPDITVIPCSADLELFNVENIDPANRSALFTKMSLSDKDMVISYLGSIGGWYLTNEMMRFCKMLSDKLPRVKFLFISPHRHEEIFNAATLHGLDPKAYCKRG